MTTVNIVNVGNTTQHCRLGFFQDSDFAGAVRIQNQPRAGVLFFRKPNFCLHLLDVQETSASHSSTESEIISLDAGLRMVGLLALDLWDVVIDVLRSTQGNANSMVPSSRETVARPKITPKPKQMTTTNVDLSNMDQVLVNAHSSHGESRWNIFEDNEAVIKMIIKREKSNHETCVWDTPSCVGLVVQRNQFRSQDPNQICRHQKPNDRLVNQR